MTEKLYTAVHCAETGRDCVLLGRVVVLSRQALAEERPNQLFFCRADCEAGASHAERWVLLVSLQNGEQHRYFRSDVLGVLKPALLPESAKLQLSQIGPACTPAEEKMPKYSGYSFLPDGRYAAGVPLGSEEEVMDYLRLQMPYQHRILICDRDEACVLEVREGELLYPGEQEREALGRQEHEAEERQHGNLF